MKNIYILIIFFICTSQNILAQITIGDTKEPAPFSLIQLEKTEKLGGFKLPRLSQSECNNLRTFLNSKPAAEKAAAHGLVVYNTDTELMQYWDGTDWAQSQASQYEIVGENGVTELDINKGGLKLGGTLDNNTTIDIKDKTLNFPTTGSQDKFLISDVASGDKTFSVVDGKVGIGTETPQAKLHIENADASLPGIRITNSQEESGYLLASDYYGNALWQPLKPLSSVKKGALYNDYYYGSDAVGTLERVDITSSPLQLTKGKWLIVAKYSANIDYQKNSNPGTNPQQYLSYLQLTKSSTRGGTQTDVTIVGSLPSQTRYTGPDGRNTYYVTPQLFYFTEVEGNDEYYYVNARASRRFRLSEAYGASYFFALRIDGMLGGGVGIAGSAVCTNLNYSANLKTGQGIDYTYASSAYARITLTTGTLYLEEGNIIGSKNGINLTVVGGPYNIVSGAGTTNVRVRVAGTLEPYVQSGTFTVPIEIPNTSLSSTCAGATINVQTEGTIDCNSLNAINIVSGKNKTVNATGNIKLNMTSGSVTLAANQVLGAVNGIIVRHNHSNSQTYYAVNNVTIPVSISGTVSSTASGQFNVPVTITGIGTCTGPVINVVDAQFDCGPTIKSPSNTPVQYTGAIDLLVNSGSAPYTLPAGRVLGSGSGITVTYTGPALNLTAGNTYTIPVTVTSANTLSLGSRSIALSNISNSGIGIGSCNMTVSVENFGTFSCSAISPITQTILAEATEPTAVNQTKSLPLTVNNGTVNINDGDILGQVTVSGKTYKVVAALSSPINVTGTSGSPQTINMNVKITGPGELNPVTRTIPIKAIGVGECNIEINFVNE